jgi:hypothetical protein
MKGSGVAPTFLLEAHVDAEQPFRQLRMIELALRALASDVDSNGITDLAYAIAAAVEELKAVDCSKVGEP